MNDLHNIQKTLAKQLNAGFDGADSSADSSIQTDKDQTVIGLADRVAENQRKEESEAIARKSVAKSSSGNNAYKPFAIGFVMLLFAAVIFVGESIL